MEENSNNPKNFWKPVKRIIPSKSDKSQQPAQAEPIKVDEQISTNPITIANVFCTYFTSIVTKLFKTVPNLTDNVMQDSDQSRVNDQPFRMEPVTAAFVRHQLETLNLTKATELEAFQLVYLKILLTVLLFRWYI